MNLVFARVTCSIAAAACIGAVAIQPAAAATVWTDWTSVTTGATGTVAGTLAGAGVTYNGEVGSAVTNGTTNIWAPNSSFIGGTSTDSPSSVNDVIYLIGSAPGTNTITFSSPVVNPLIAIWSLGSPVVPASFTFNQTPTFEAGGPNIAFGGGPIVVAGNVVSGREGNGVVQFSGTFSSLSWTDTFENYYGFTVGTAGPVPEPSEYLMLVVGLVLLGTVVRRRSKF
jgi:hypothetical protein